MCNALFNPLVRTYLPILKSATEFKVRLLIYGSRYTLAKKTAARIPRIAGIFLNCLLLLLSGIYKEFCLKREQCEEMYAQIMNRAM